MLEMTNGGRLLIFDLDAEAASSQLINLTDSGTFTLALGRHIPSTTSLSFPV